MKYITLKRGFKYQNIQLTDIYFIESRNKEIAIHAKSGVSEYYHTIQDIEKELDSSFFRCHRCYIISLRYVKVYSSSAVKMETGAKIPISRRKYAHFINALRMYMENVDLE